jgi:hypothetical protein
MTRNYIAFSEIAESDKTYIVALISILKNHTTQDMTNHLTGMTCVLKL